MNLLNEFKIVILICIIKIEYKFFSFKDLIKQRRNFIMQLLKPHKLDEPEEIYNSLLKYKKFFKLKCLHLAIILSRILNILGVKHKFIIGVKFENGSFKSHAWIKSHKFIMQSDGYNEIYSHERS